MPISTTLESPVTAKVAAGLEEDLDLEGGGASATVDTTDPVVYVIQSSFNYRDPSNHPKSDEDLVVLEGWFADRASAAVRCTQLNARNHAYYDACMATKARERDVAIRVAQQKNQEAAAIRAAGMLKADIAVPSPFVPETFEKFFSGSNHTTYEPVEIRRSDHDGIARAGG